METAYFLRYKHSNEAWLDYIEHDGFYNYNAEPMYFGSLAEAQEYMKQRQALTGLELCVYAEITFRVE